MDTNVIDMICYGWYGKNQRVNGAAVVGAGVSGYCLMYSRLIGARVCRAGVIGTTVIIGDRGLGIDVSWATVVASDVIW